MLSQCMRTLLRMRPIVQRTFQKVTRTMDRIKTQDVNIERLGFGTFRMPGADCQPVVEGALGIGYRHIDTAAMYENEASVGAAISASGIERGDLFVTTKVWHDSLASASAIRRAFDASLSRLKLDFVDMYMVHWPSAAMVMDEVMETLTALRDEGRTRAIGVCNFNLPMMRRAVDELGAPIAALQVEYHPFLDQSPMLSYLAARNIPLVAYAPLAQGRAASDETLATLGRKHGVSGAQVAIAWLLDQPGVIAIPKAGRPASQAANLAAVDVRLDDEDRAAIARLPKNLRYVRPPFAPDWDAA